MKEIAAIIILCLPTAVELYADRNGDTNKVMDTVVRIMMMIAVGLIVWGWLGKNMFVAMNMSFAIFFLIFDYAIHIILYRNGVIASPAWFRYTGKSSKVDNLPIWKRIGPYGRFFVKLFYFLGSIWLYFKF